jgi:hypothetical protein
MNKTLAYLAHLYKLWGELSLVNTAPGPNSHNRIICILQMGPKSYNVVPVKPPSLF